MTSGEEMAFSAVEIGSEASGGGYAGGDLPFTKVPGERCCQPKAGRRRPRDPSDATPTLVRPPEDN